jgi:mercuric ion binding protein
MKKINFALIIVTVMLNAVSFSVTAQEKNNGKVTIQTSGHCGECKETIEKALTFEKGVKTAAFDIQTGKVDIVYNPSKTDPDKLRTAIIMAGYDADSLQADPKAYSKLKECCKKEGKDSMKH